MVSLMKRRVMSWKIVAMEVDDGSPLRLEQSLRTSRVVSSSHSRACGLVAKDFFIVVSRICLVVSKGTGCIDFLCFLMHNTDSTQKSSTITDGKAIIL